MQITQALVAIGGKARRIRGAGIAVPLSKSFLALGGLPLLYWTLISLYAAGIRRLVLCGNDPLHLREAELLLDRLGLAFDEACLFEDPGFGVHGLPYQVLFRNPKLLDDTFLFECGHSLMRPIHYRRLAQVKEPGAIVFSAFKPHPSNRRQPVRLVAGCVDLAASPERPHALAHPMVIDRRYALRLPLMGFNVEEIITWYAREQAIRYIFSEMPPEFDVRDEMRDSYCIYRKYLALHGLLPHQVPQAIGTITTDQFALGSLGSTFRPSDRPRLPLARSPQSGYPMLRPTVR